MGFEIGAQRQRSQCKARNARSTMLALMALSACAPRSGNEAHSGAPPASTAVSAAPRALASATVAQPKDERVYERGLTSGWQDWGWGRHDLSGVTARIDFSNYGGFILHHDVLGARFQALTFRMRAPRSFGNFLELRVANGDPSASYPVVVPVLPQASAADGWTEVSVPWSALNPAGLEFDRIIMHAKAQVNADWVEFEQVSLTANSVAAEAHSVVSAPVHAARVSVDCRAKDHPISPFIYGVAGDVWGLKPTARRWGGNPKTRYNWQLADAQNTGSDWFFENVKSDDYREFLRDNSSHRAVSALTVPIIGWVAKDQSSFGFPRSVFGPQRAEDQYRSGAGNGVRLDGTPIGPGKPEQTSVAAPPEFIRKWVEAIRAQDQATGARQVHMYILDNEPNLWSSTHRDVHPEPLSYDELLDRTIRYGEAVRAADPQAIIAGPAEWGWTGYLYSARDALMGVGLRPDRRAHGDVPLIPWFLRKLREYRQKTGTRILDALDVHYYPQAAGVYGPMADAQTAALRLRSTRSLWDPTYEDESWIKDNVKLIPRLKAWIADNDPGLKLSIGEYNFGAEQDMSGALALAEALGRFGIEGVDYAYYWIAPAEGSPAYWAFRAFRNFDDRGGQFLERSLVTRANDGVSLFASRDAAGKHLVLIALNMDPQNAAQTKFDLSGCTKMASSRRFSYLAGMPSIAEQAVAVSSGDLDETLAPYSINVFDILLK